MIGGAPGSTRVPILQSIWAPKNQEGEAILTKLHSPLHAEIEITATETLLGPIRLRGGGTMKNAAAWQTRFGPRKAWARDILKQPEQGFCIQNLKLQHRRLNLGPEEQGDAIDDVKYTFTFRSGVDKLN